MSGDVYRAMLEPTKLAETPTGLTKQWKLDFPYQVQDDIGGESDHKSILSPPR